jgi:hypothetical protein
MILTMIIGRDIYLDSISHSWYRRLMIPMRIIGQDIYLDSISCSRYGRLRFIGIDINIEGIYGNEHALLFLKNAEG